MNPVRVRSITVIGLLILTTTITTGCDYLGLGPTPGPPLPRTSEPSLPQATPTPTPTLPATGSDDAGDSGEPGASVDPGDPFGAAEATYRTGIATLTVGEQVITLGRLAGIGTYFAEFGADVIWTGNDGWYLQVGGAKPNIGPIGIPAYIAIDWVHDGQHWVSWDADGCAVTIDQADPAGVRGTAECTNMRWVDAIAGNLADEPPAIAGQPPFAVSIQFVARP